MEIYLLDNTVLKLAEGPNCPTLTEEEKEMEEVRRYMMERSKSCCRRCGIYLEIDERNTQMKCNICFWKPFNAKHFQPKVSQEEK